MPMPAASDDPDHLDDLTELDDAQHHAATACRPPQPPGEERRAAPITSATTTTIGPVDPLPKMRTTP